MKDMLKRINNALPGLLLGILLYGAIVEIIGVWFVEDKIRYSSGLAIGIVCALIMAIHMAIVIEDSVSLNSEKAARVRTTTHSLIRYVVIVVLFFLLVYFNLGNMFTAIIGVMGLKASAYAQPLIYKLHRKFLGLPPETEEQEQV